MPRFAANLGYLFTDRPLVERFGAASAAGFKAVELQFPYDLAASAARAEIDRHNLTMLGVNTRATPEAASPACPGASRISPRCLPRRSITLQRSAVGPYTA